MPHHAMPRRYLMGPGPAPVEPSVLTAMNRPLIGHLDPAFLALMDRVGEDLRFLFRTDNPTTFPVSGTGSAGMEAALVNLLEPGVPAVVAVCGAFGARMAEMARRAGAEVTIVEAPWGRPVPTHDISQAARSTGATVVAAVHAETSTGVRQPVEELRPAVGPEPLLVVDAVTSLAGMRVEVDEWGIDVCYSGTQKCISAPPGLAPITFSPRAVERIGNRSQPVVSWYLDVSLLSGYWTGDRASRAYHHTAPISMMFALAEALHLIRKEGLEERWMRHEEAGRFLQTELSEMGFDMLAPRRFRLPQLTAAVVPPPVDGVVAKRRLRDDFSIEVGSGLGDMAQRLWRIGLMGRGASRRAAVRLIQAIEAVIAV